MRTLYLPIAVCAGLLSGIFFTSIVCAELIAVDWKTAGDELLIKDTETGYKWLKITETNRSFRETQGSLGTCTK